MQYRRAIAGLAIALGLVALLIYGVGWAEVVALLGDASGIYVGAGAISGALILVFRGAVVDTLLHPVPGRARGVPFGLAFLGGYFARSALPWGRSTGSPIMAYLLAANGDSAFEDNLAVVALAELVVFAGSVAVGTLGILAYLATTGDLEALSHLLEEAWETGSVSVVAFVGGAFLTALVLGTVIVYTRRGSAPFLAFGRATARWADARLQSIPRVSSVDPVSSRLEGFVRTLETVSADRRTLWTAIAIAFASWLVNVFPLYFALLALGVEGSFALALLCAPLATIGGVIPLPGGTGGIETALVVLLVTLGGLNPELATAVTLLYRLSTYWVHLTIGGAGALVLSARGERTLSV